MLVRVIGHHLHDHGHPMIGKYLSKAFRGGSVPSWGETDNVIGCNYFQVTVCDLLTCLWSPSHNINASTPTVGLKLLEYHQHCLNFANFYLLNNCY